MRSMLFKVFISWAYDPVLLLRLLRGGLLGLLFDALAWWTTEKQAMVNWLAHKFPTST